MRTILFSSQTYDRDSFLAADLPADIELHFQSARLSLDTVALAEQHEVVCAFINDDLGAPVLERLAAGGTRLIALRSAGYNHVDLAAGPLFSGEKTDRAIAAADIQNIAAWQLLVQHLLNQDPAAVVDPVFGKNAGVRGQV